MAKMMMMTDTAMNMATTSSGDAVSKAERTSHHWEITSKQA